MLGHGQGERQGRLPQAVSGCKIDLTLSKVVFTLQSMGAKQNVANTVRRHRLLADEMTQQELADLVGVTRQTIHAIEKGRYNPSVGLALSLARVFDVGVEELFQLDEEEDYGKR